MADKPGHHPYNPYLPTADEVPGSYDRDLAAADLDGRAPVEDPDATRLSVPVGVGEDPDATRVVPPYGARPGFDPDATRVVPAGAATAAADPGATSLVSDPGATRMVAASGATRLAPRAQAPADPGATRVVPVQRPVAGDPYGRTAAAPAAPTARPQRPVADLGRAEAARDMLDRQAAWGASEGEGWVPGRAGSRPKRRAASKGPLDRRRLRFWRWFRTIPILLMVLAGLLSVGLSVLPGATLRHWLYPVYYADAVTRSASVHGVDPYLVAAVIKSESNWVSTARSGAGAQGLMQIMPDTARELASKGYVDSSSYDPADLADPVTNIEYGTAYLSYLLDTTGSVDEAVAAYNAGPGAASQWKGSGGDFADAIEYPETRLYLERVQEASEQYKSLYPNGLVDDKG